MNVIAKKTLRAFWDRGHAEAVGPMEAWYREARRGHWRSFADVKRQFSTADLVGGNKLVFNVGGNKYRIVCKIAFPHPTLFVKWVGTHAEYGKLKVDEL